MAAMMPSSSISTGSSSSTTVVQQTEQQTGAEQVASEVVRLKLSKPPQPQKKVSWTETTVDNEHMGKKKSKCCCVYVKPRAFDESDSDPSDGECDNCSGHVEKRRGGGSQQPPDGGDGPGGGGQGVPAAS